MVDVLKNQRGLGLISIILIIVIMGLVGAGLVSMTNTETFSAMGQNAGLQALGVAEGGIEYALRFVPAANFPNYSLPRFSDRALPIGQCNGDPGICLGGGRFVVDPPAVLTAPINELATTLSVDSTVPFGGIGTTRRIAIGLEFMDCTILDGVTFFPCVRNQNSPPIAPPTSPLLDHQLDDSIYPGAELDGGLGAGTTTIPVLMTTGIIIPGPIKIDSEAIYCTGTDTTVAVCGAGNVACFTGCVRGYKGTTASGHANGDTVIQRVITSTGTVTTPVFGSAQRMVQVTVDQ